MSDVPVEFAVWAPLPERVRLQVDGAVHDMRRDDDGWWRAEVEAGPEADYGFLLDDNETPRPTRARGGSPRACTACPAAVRPGAHEWGDGAWTGRPLAGGVVYELHVGTFTPEGTLDAAIERLDHLVDLGVDFVELLPVNAFNGTHNWGYDGVLWYAVQETYGGPAAYQRFVDACHQRGLGVIQDVVYNHLGPSGTTCPSSARTSPRAARTPGATRSTSTTGPDSDEVRRYIIDNALMWLRDCHVDGLRLDAVHALVDERATHVLEELAARSTALSVAVGRPLTLIAESDLNDPRWSPRGRPAATG
jgi:maltooligosyltrehalose trehalohydrolase